MSLTKQTFGNNYKKLRHIVVDEVNYERLRDLGKARDSFNDVLNKIFSGEVDPKRLKIQ